MNMEISDKELEEIIKRQLTVQIGNRINKVMNDGMASWFTQQNISNLTRECITRLIEDTVNKKVSDFMNKINYNKLSDIIGKSVSDYIRHEVFGICDD